MFYYTSVHLRRRLSFHRRTWLFGYHPFKQARRRAAKRMPDLKKQGDLNASEHCLLQERASVRSKLVPALVRALMWDCSLSQAFVAAMSKLCFACRQAVECKLPNSAFLKR